VDYFTHEEGGRYYYSHPDMPDTSRRVSPEDQAMVIGILQKWERDMKRTYDGLREVAQMVETYKATVAEEKRQHELLVIEVDYERL
jgi:hypothetical protein